MNMKIVICTTKRFGGTTNYPYEQGFCLRLVPSRAFPLSVATYDFH